MVRRPRLALLLAAVLVAAAAPALAWTPIVPWGDESVAITDDARAMLLDPAALGVRYPGELRIGWGGTDGDLHWTRTLASAGGFGGFVVTEPSDVRTYGLAFAGGEDALRIGWSPRWRAAGGGPLVADHRIGALSRPRPWLSAAAVVAAPFGPRFGGGARAPAAWTFGLGLRPLALDRGRAHDLGTRLTLAADVRVDDWNDRENARPLFTAELEPLPGVVLNASYSPDPSPVGSSEFSIGLTLRSVHGSIAGARRERREGGAGADRGELAFYGAQERTVLAPAAERRVAVVRAGGLLADESMGGGALFGGPSTVSSAPLHAQLERALEDPLVRGVLLDLRGVAGRAQLEELRPRVGALRAAGKPVVAFLEYGGGRGDLYLASACDRVIATEEADFRGLGLRTERRYYRAFLEKLGVRIDRASVGKYKSAYRQYSVDSTGAADAEVIDSVLDEVQAQLVDALAEGRGVPAERFAHVLDGRAWTSADLVAAGLADSVGYREDALATLGRLSGLGAKPRTVNLRRAPLARREWTRRSPVAVVYAGGAIETGRSGSGLLMGPYMGNETVSAQLERAFKTPGVKAVVMRVESPGGAALASNLIDHTVQRLKRETGKPFIVSMGSVAASGGYYISSHADRIYADLATYTGSIGVLFVKPSLEGFYAKHDVRQDVFQRGDWMGGTSFGEDWTPAFQASADSAVSRSYDVFVSKVADGRGLDPKDVRDVAQGRVWLGEDAVKHRLVDRIGGLEAAVAEARSRAGVPPDERIRLFELHRPQGGFLERLVRGWVTDQLERDASLRTFQGPQYLDPYWLEGIGE